MKQPERRALQEESNRWVRAIYAIADPVFFLLCVVVGFMMIIQDPWVGAPFIASGAVLAYRVVHGVRSPWL